MDSFTSPTETRTIPLIESLLHLRLASRKVYKAILNKRPDLDNLSREMRSKIMRAIKSANTRPELCVRRAVYSLGYRYRVKGSKLRGKPDLVFRSRRKLIFVHGCFWHVHKGCALSHIPKYEYWRDKLTTNVTRDRATLRALKRSGWKTLVLWECELLQPERISRKLCAFLGPPTQ